MPSSVSYPYLISLFPSSAESPVLTHLIVPSELAPPAHARVRPDHRLRLDPRVQRGYSLQNPVRLAAVRPAAARAPQSHLAAAGTSEPNPFLALRSALQGRKGRRYL